MNTKTVSGAVGPLDHTFTATLTRGTNTGAWTCVITDWTTDFFGTRGLFKVTAPSTVTPSRPRSWPSETAPTNSPSPKPSRPPSPNTPATPSPSTSPNATQNEA